MSVPLQYAIQGDSASAVAASVEEGLRRGRLRPGDPLPTVRALAGRLGLSPATVAAAYRTLQARGLVTGQGRRGTRVAFRPPVPLPRPDPVIPSHLRDLATGNPDPARLPPLGPALAARRAIPPTLYGEPPHRPALLALAARHFRADGVQSDA